MKQDERFITVKEERVYLAKYFLWFLVVWLVIVAISALLNLDALKEENGVRNIVVIAGGGCVLLLLVAGWLWFTGKSKQKEREAIMANGRKVTGIVKGVQTEMTGGILGAKIQYHRVVVQYTAVNGEEKTWVSPRYRVEPYNYVGLQKECTLYLWGEKGCLEDVLPRKKESLEEQLGKYAFLAPKESDSATKKAASNEKGKKKTTEFEFMEPRKTKDIHLKYRIEEFKQLDKAALEEAKDEWNDYAYRETDSFLRFRPELMSLAKPIGHYFVYLEVRFISKRICSFSVRYNIEQDFDACIKELNYQYLETDYEFLKEHIRTCMEASAQKHFGMKPVTEVLVELL